MATMKNINYWRTKVREAEAALNAAEQIDLPVGTKVSYLHGNNEIVVRIVEHNRAGSYVKVANIKTGYEYLLDYDRFHRVID